MTILREEISNIIFARDKGFGLVRNIELDHIPLNDQYKFGIDKDVDEILQVVEQKIDNLETFAGEHPPKSIKVKEAIKNKEIDEKYYQGFSDGFLEALRELKQEIKQEK